MTGELAPCGTESAYQRHRRRGEVPDFMCVEAAKAAKRLRRNGRRVRGQVDQEFMIRDAVRLLAEAMGVTP